MNKIVAGFMVLFVLLSLLSAIMDGAAGAAAATTLTADITEDDTTLDVTSTTAFLAGGGVLMIDNEKIEYGGVTAITFTGCVRGYEGTSAEPHLDDAVVYSEDLGVINYALGYNAMSVSGFGVQAGVPLINMKFFTVTIPRIVLWDYGFLDGELIILRYILMAMSTGFIIYLAYHAINTAIGLLQAVLPW